MAKLEPRGRKVKILATLGPASRDARDAAPPVPGRSRRVPRQPQPRRARDHAATIAAIRALEKEFNRPIAILCDLQGPKLRVGTFAEGQAVIRHGSQFTLDRDPAPGNANRVCLPHPELFEVLAGRPAAADQRRQDPAAGDRGQAPTGSSAPPKSAG